MDTIGALFTAWIHPDAARPVLTFYDDGTGERTELSGATLANWVAKTANLLVDGCGLGPGDRVSVLLPPHWQTAAVLLGCWSAGVCVDLDGGPADAAFATADRLASSKAGDVFGLALAPLAAPMRPGPPIGVHDYVVEVRGHGDRFEPPVPVQPGDAAVPDLTHSDLCRRAVQRGVPAGARILVDGDATTDPVDWLLAPMAANASIVLCRHLDPAAVPGRAAAERVTVI
jgi:uncharacterized protein (TIGR03089 family)